MNCSLPPEPMAEVDGVTEIEVSDAAVTTRLAVPVMAAEVAVMVALPGDTAVARPDVLTVALAAAELLQVTVPLRSCVVPSE